MKGKLRNQLRGPETALLVANDILRVWAAPARAGLLVAPAKRRTVVRPELCVRRSALEAEMASVYLCRRVRVMLDYFDPMVPTGLCRVRVVRLDRLETDLVAGGHLRTIDILERVVREVRQLQTARAFLGEEWVSL